MVAVPSFPNLPVDARIRFRVGSNFEERLQPPS
jgi:hypothetical protein